MFRIYIVQYINNSPHAYSTKRTDEIPHGHQMESTPDQVYMLENVDSRLTSESTWEIF